MIQRQLENLVGGGLTLLLALMPFHAFLTVVLGLPVVLQAWKELVLAGLVLVTGLLLWQTPSRLKQLGRDYNYAAIAFIAIALIVSLANGESGSPSWWLGVKTNLAGLTVFLVAQFARPYVKERLLVRILLITSAVVVVWGLAVELLLTSDFLSRLGYSTQTIDPLQGIAGSNVVRLFSTLGGPNQLGAFLIVPLCLLTHRLLKRFAWIEAVLLMATTLALFYTFSRSAWIGAAIGVTVVTLVTRTGWQLRLVFLAAAAAVVMLLAFGRNLVNVYPQLDAVVSHEDATGAPDDGSDDKRLAEWRRGLIAVAERPMGRGLGTAGPASYAHSEPRIPESWYLQIAIETGLAGLTAFLALIYLVGRRLWSLRHGRALATPLLGALAGISIVNLFLHGWADSTLAYVYWTLAGIAIGETV